MNITRLSIDRPILLAVFYILVVFTGLASFSWLNYELVPQFNPPVITAVTIYPGASPKEVEQEVSIPIEDAFASLENIETINSISQGNFSLVKLDLNSKADVDEVLQTASRKLLSVVADLPDGARTPVLSRFDFNDLPIIRLSAFSDDGMEALTEFCNKTVVPALSQINGVADVDVSGGIENQVYVSIDPERLSLYHVSVLQVLKTIGETNQNIPVGNLESEKLNIPVEMKGRFASLDEIRNQIIYKNKDYGLGVRVGDVAEVYEAHKPLKVYSYLNGNAALGLSIKKQSNANTVEISEKLMEVLLAMEDEYKAKNLRFEFTQDNSQFTKAAARSVGIDLIFAIILVSLVMLIFLHSIRNSLVVFVSIPISILATFIVMYLLGYSLNLLTLLGLSLSIGILVDDSIVILENINRHLKMGKSARRAAYDGRMEIGFTAISITLIDVIVFVPIILSQGMVADMLRPFSVVVVSSTLMSLLVSFTLIPFMASRFTRATEKQSSVFASISQWIEQKFAASIDEVTRVLLWSFKHVKWVLLLVLLMLVGSIMFIPTGFIGVEFTKGGDRSEFIIELELDQNATIQESNKVAKQVDEILRSYADVETVFINVGITSSGRIVSNSQYLSEVYVKLKSKEERSYKTSAFARHIKRRLMKDIPGLKVTPVEINLVGLRDDDAVQVTLTGSSSDTLMQSAQKVYKSLEGISGAIELQSNIDKGKRIISVKPNREAMHLYDVDPLQAGVTLRTAVNGMSDFSYKNGEKSLPIHIGLNKNYANSIIDLQQISVLNSEGASIPLYAFSEIKEVYEPSSIERINRASSVTIKSQVIGRPAGSVSGDLGDEIKAMGLPASVQMFWGGATKRTQDGLKSLLVALVASILLMYLILVALYNSFSYPLVVLFSIPLAIIGAFLALALNMEALSVFTILGLIILIGLVGKNSILVVDFANKLQEKSLTPRTAIVESVKLRFKPVIMTNLTMIIGLLPIALSQGAGAEWKNGMAWALIGGLSSSLLLTFIVVPIIYLGVNKFFKSTK